LSSHLRSEFSGTVRGCLPIHRQATMIELALRRLVVAALVLFALRPAGAGAAGVEDFYRGRSVPLVIGYSAGSGYDLYARLLGRFIARYIPGNPAIIPQNMPGAGSLKATMYMRNVAAKDGSVIATVGRSVPLEPLLGEAQFDAREFAWLGSIASNSSLCVSWHTSAIKAWGDALTKPFALAGEGSGSDPDNFARILKNLFGAKVRLVTGYPGGTEMNLAIERGEVDGRCGWSWDSIKSTRPNWLRERRINLLAVFSLQKAPDIPDGVPLIGDLATTDEQRQILRLHLAGQAFGRPFFTAPGVPPERKAALRAAFAATMQDRDFIMETNKVGLEVNPASGDEIDRLLAEIYATPKSVIEQAKQAVRN
jgi:tripartite-type tricarboxylate transporter receptor subunit TctC